MDEAHRLSRRELLAAGAAGLPLLAAGVGPLVARAAQASPIVKWVGDIEVSDRPLSSPWNTTSYRMFGPSYPADSPPLAEQQVKSAFELPWEARLPAGRQLVLSGRSWSGRAPIRAVEVSADGGATWRRARPHGPNRANAWVRWESAWPHPAPGRHELLARATDRAGLTQPPTVPFNQLGYQFWAVVRHPVLVAEA